MADEDRTEDFEDGEELDPDLDDEDLDEDDLDDEEIVLDDGDLDDDDLDDEELDDDEEDGDEAGPAPVKKTAEDDDEDDPDDVEADLDAILKDRIAAGDDEDEDEDEEVPAVATVAGPDDVQAKSEDERTCQSCFLIKPLIQFPGDGDICVDCS